jgi:hypothetical protein
LTYSDHAVAQLAERGITLTDALNVLRGGHVEGSDLIAGTWRYRVRTPRMVVVVAFRSEREMRVITGWRIGR